MATSATLPSGSGRGVVTKVTRLRAADLASNAATTIPFDNTTPLVSEGTEYSPLNLTVVKRTASSILAARVTLPLVSASGLVDLTFALFCGSTLIAVKPLTVPNTDYSMGLVLDGDDVTGAAGNYAFTLRWGRSSGTGYINRLHSFTLYNGSSKAAIEVQEIEP